MLDYNKFSKDQLIEKLEKANNIIQKQEIELRELREAYDKLLLQYDNKTQKALRDAYNTFVDKKEKLKDDELIINEAEHKASENKRGRKTGGTNFSTNLKPSRTIVLKPDETICPKCGEVLIEAGEDQTIKIIRHPASYEAVLVISKKYTCPNKECNYIVQNLNDDAFPHSPVTPSVVADVLNTKYSLGVPLDRYSKYLISQGINISTQNLSNYVIRAAHKLEPLYNSIKNELVNNKAQVIHVDETTLKVLDVNDRQNCYMFVYTTSFYDNQVYLYEFSPTRKTDKTAVLLKRYNGYLVCDKYSGYNCFSDQLRGVQRCLAHARRYFYDIVKTLKSSEKKESKAYQVVLQMAKIFEAEASYKKNHYTIEKIVEERNSKEYQRMVDDLHDLIWGINPASGSLLEKAVNYAKKSWDEFFVYRNWGYLEPTNNIAERAVKPFVIGRKNFLFSKTENGAQSSGVIYSIIQTARANGLVIDRYLEYVLSNIDKENIDNLLPWSKNLPVYLKLNINKK